jgi:hypothetical protein
MVVFSQTKADGRIGAKGRRRDAVLHGQLRELGVMRREYQVRLGSVRRTIIKHDDGRSLRDKLDPGYCALETRKRLDILKHGHCATPGCGCEQHEPQAMTCLMPIELEGDAYASIRECYKLLDGLRPFSRPRTRACRRKRIAPTVQIFTDGKRLTIEGICTCGNANGCPVCARKIYMKRQSEIEYMLSRWIGHEPGRKGPLNASAGMLTLTIKHGAGDALTKTAHGINEAWRLMFTGRGGQRLKKQFDLQHFVRAFETTHGQANGWHPHLHAVTLHNTEPTTEALQAIAERWRECVCQALGQQFAPDITESGNGVDYKRIDAASDGKYLAKMGLEIAGIYFKAGKNGNRTYWEIARNAASGDTYAQHLWVDAQAALFRTKQLTWSRGTRAWFELEDLSDEQIAAEGETLEPPPLQIERYRLEVSSDKWDDACRRDRFFVSRLVGAALAAEASGNWGGVLGVVTGSRGTIGSCRPGGGNELAYASTDNGTSGSPRSNCQMTTPSTDSRNATT